MIHILNAQTDELVGVLDNKGERIYWDDVHKQGIDGYNVFQFMTFADIPESRLLEKRSRIIVKSENDYWQEFIVFESTADTSKDMEVVAVGSETDIDKQIVIEPKKYNGLSAEQYITAALKETEWKIGAVEYGGTRTIEIDDFIGGYQFLRTIADAFEMELVFRIEVSGNVITGRYVDMVHRIGEDNAKEIVYGKDLVGIERKVYSERIVTAIFAVGPEREDGTRLTTLVTNEEAFQRWNRNGKHIIGIHEPQTEDGEMTLERLKTLGKMELDKRIDAVTEYTVTAESIEELYPHERVRLGDTVRIIDTEFEPPLYAEARVIEVERSLTNAVPKVYTIGNVVEYDVDELRRAFRDMQKQYGTTVVRAPQPPEGKYNVIWIDTSGNIDVAYTWGGTQWIKFTPETPGDIGALTPDESKIIAELENITTIRRILTTNKSELDLEYDTLTGNPYIAGTIYRDELDDAKSDADTKYADAVAYIDMIITSGTITPAQRTQLVTKINAAQDAQAVFGAYLTRAFEAVASAQALEAKQQAVLAAQAAADALVKANTALTDVINKVDQSTFDTRFNELKDDIANIDLSGLDVYTKVEIDNALAGLVKTTTYEFDRDAMRQSITDNTTAITQNAAEIALKASSDSVAQLQSAVTEIESDVSAAELRLSDVELAITDSAIVSTVTSSLQFEALFDTKADASDLAGYATSDAVNNLMGEVNSLGDELRGIQFGKFVTQTELEQRDLALVATISASSGVNLVRNSVGLAKLEHWSTSGNGSISPTASNELVGLGYHSGFLLDASGTGSTKMSQDVAVIAGKPYTLSFALRNITTTGDVTVRVLDAVTGTVVDTAPTYSESGAGLYGNKSLTFVAPSNQLRIEVSAPQSKQAIITAIMLNIGTVAFSWTTAVGELYNTTIKMDLNGLRVSQYEGDKETGFTVMTPEKFAGYYNGTGVINENTGSDDEVFRMDKDEFVMKKATVKSEITMGSVKVLEINDSSRKGWAFVPNLT